MIKCTGLTILLAEFISGVGMFLVWLFVWPYVLLEESYKWLFNIDDE